MRTWNVSEQSIFSIFGSFFTGIIVTASSSETSVPTYLNTERYVPKDLRHDIDCHEKVSTDLI
jgi:hypothetical protein